MIKDPLIFIEHIIESIKNIEVFMNEVNKENFFKNTEKQSAIVRQLEIIGEAAKNLPSDFTNKYSGFNIVNRSVNIFSQHVSW